MDKRIDVSVIDQADIFRLVELMRACDDILRDLFASIVGISFLPEHFVPIKASAIFWGRVTELLGLSDNSCVTDMPVLYPNDFYGDSGYERGVCDEIADFIVSWYDLADPDVELLEKTDIAISTTSLSPDDVSGCIEVVTEDAINAGEVIDEDGLRKRAYECLTEQTFPLFSATDADFSSFISCIEEWAFYAAEIVCLRSKRVGNFIKNLDILRIVLPKELFTAVKFLINAVFDPLYAGYDELGFEWLNAAGEYCSVFCLGDSEDSVEDVLYGIHKRPYADVAVALLDRLLKDVESMAPDILSDMSVSADAA